MMKWQVCMSMFVCSGVGTSGMHVYKCACVRLCMFVCVCCIYTCMCVV